MSGASEVPAIPEDVRKLVDALVRGSAPGNTKIVQAEAIAIRDELLRLEAIVARRPKAEPVAWRLRLDEQDAWAYFSTDMTKAPGLFDYQIEPLFAHPPTRREKEIRNASLEEAAKLADAQWNARVVPEARGESELGKAIRALAARPVDTGREKALEEAAKVAERPSPFHKDDDEWWEAYDGGRKDAAAAIRALANSENGRG